MISKPFPWQLVLLCAIAVLTNSYLLWSEHNPVASLFFSTMTLYFDTKIEFLDSDAVSTIGIWHPIEPLFAVASLSQERGGSVTIFSDTVSFSNN